jgi:hypothetical protein
VRKSKTIYETPDVRRNDLVGGSGTGLGGVILHANHSDPISVKRKRENDPMSDEPKAGYRKKERRATNNRKQKKNFGKKRLGKRQKRLKNNRQRDIPGVPSHQGAWSNREKQIVPYHGSSVKRGGGENDQYMQISNLDPALRNVGGAKIIFR